MIESCHLAHLVPSQAVLLGERTAFLCRDDAKGVWRPVSWHRFAVQVERAARALLWLGIAPQQRVGLFTCNCYEAFCVDFAAFAVRAVTVPMYPTSSLAQVRDMAADAEVQMLFVGEQRQYDLARQVDGLRLIVLDDAVRLDEADTTSLRFAEFLALDSEGKFAAQLAERRRAVQFDDLANILYTSGTTGRGKGVPMTHRMYLHAIEANARVLPLSRRDVVMNFLPLTHVLERGWSYLALTMGCTLAPNRHPADIVRSLREVRPTAMSTVPRFWEKIREGVLARAGAPGSLKRKVFDNAMAVGRAYVVDYIIKGIKPPRLLELKYRLADRTLFQTVRRTLGLERANFFPTAGAVISPAVEEFVHICGLNMVKGYGLTESTATVSCDKKGMPFSIGSVGRVLDEVQVRIAPDGEVQLRGETIVAGYYRDPEATRDSFTADGWFRTGDAGYLKDGELYLTDRIKDLYKTSNGKYIAPQQIEGRLDICPYIDQTVIIADGRKFVSALIVPSRERLEAYAKAQGFGDMPWPTLCQDERAKAFILARIDAAQADLASYEQVKRITLLPEPFSMQRDELTNTLKLRRRVIQEHYHEAIERMYQDVPNQTPPTTGTGN